MEPRDRNSHTRLKRADKIRDWLLDIRRYQKRLILMANDLALLSLALVVAFSIRLGELIYPLGIYEWLVFASAPLIGVACLNWAGVYLRITRYVGNTDAKRVLIGISLSVLIWSLFVFMTDIDIETVSGVPRSVVVAYWALGFLFIWASREIAGWYLIGSRYSGFSGEFSTSKAEKKKILIWGYSEMALQLARVFKFVDNYDPVGIVDDDVSLHYSKADNIKIFPPDRLEALIENRQISEIFLDSAIVSREKRLEIVRQLEGLPVVLKVLPSVQDIVSGKIAIDRIRSIRVEDLLGRDAVPHHEDLLKESVFDKVVMVTGAGGSIGSEMVRQLIRLAPKKLILFDISEAALYEISSELAERVEAGFVSGSPEILSRIGSVADANTVGHLMRKYRVQTIYHAAAYKHVPLVEINPFAGLENNAFGTWTLAKAALEYGVERFVLISTDKAVRPTNIMGASKRLAEMVLQGMSNEPDCKTIFCMVRFGNVLDSSGSVVPKFRKQIENGGPVTVTHPDVIRYFMSIREAVGLVIQAGTLAKAGAVFVLDMGEPVKIVDLARTMIQLAGQSVRDADNPDGDIAIEYTGLRPGEKLYEELLIGENTSPTRHPRIKRHEEPFLPLDELSGHLARLHELIVRRDEAGVRQLLREIVEGYEASPGQPDRGKTIKMSNA